LPPPAVGAAVAPVGHAGSISVLLGTEVGKRRVLGRLCAQVRETVLVVHLVELILRGDLHPGRRGPALRRGMHSALWGLVPVTLEPGVRAGGLARLERFAWISTFTALV